MITLEVLAGEKAGATFELDLPLLTLGRAPSNQVVLSDYHLSGEHGQIFREDDRYIYRDLKSTNGSRVRRNGSEISLDDGTHETMLVDGDELILGDPTQPVVLRCRVKIEDDGRGKQEIIAKRDLSELPEVQGKIERDGARAALYNVAKKLGRRGLDSAVGVRRRRRGGVRAGDQGRLRGDRSRRRRAHEHRVHQEPIGRAAVRPSRSVVRAVQREKGALIIRDVQAELPASSPDTEDGDHRRHHRRAAVGRRDHPRRHPGRQRARRASRAAISISSLALANMATLAIENARLVQRLRLAEEKLRGE